MSLGSALHVGKSALLAYQQALQLTGHNIANAANPTYTRQVARFGALPGANSLGVTIGTGVQITGIDRKIIAELEARLRSSVSDRDSAQAKQTALDRIDSLYNALDSTNLGASLNSLSKAFSDLQNSPDDATDRGVVVRRGIALADHIQKTRRDLIGLREDLNEDVVSLTSRADTLLTQIADLNTQIVAAEGGAVGSATGLRDQQNALLSELSSIVNIRTRAQPDGSTNVFIGSDPVVLNGTSLGLTTTLQPIGGGLTKAVVRIKENGAEAVIHGGQIAGAIEARDNGVAVQLERLTQMAKAVIQEVNKRHAGGQGLTAFTNLTGNYAVLDSNVPLNSSLAGLDAPPKSGSFYINLKDKATGQIVTRQINVDLDGANGDDTTLNSLAAQINTAFGGNLTATVQADGRLNLSAASGQEFTFADDRSNTLAALGLNTFFKGRDASDIAVSDLIAGDSSFIAASANGLPGDGTNAGALSRSFTERVTLLSGATVNEYWQSSATQAAVDTNAATNEALAADVIVDSLQAQHESISGVNLDEEAVKLVTYQRSFQSAAQYLSVIDEMLQTLLGLVR